MKLKNQIIALVCGILLSTGFTRAAEIVDGFQTEASLNGQPTVVADGEVLGGGNLMCVTKN